MRTSTDIPIKILILSGLLACTLLAGAFAVPTAFAEDYDDLSTAISQAKDIKEKIENARSEYIFATQRSEEIAAQKQEIEKELATTQQRLEKEREKLDHVVVVAYKHEDDFIDALLGAEDFHSFLQQIDYLNRIAENRKRVIAEISKLEAELKEILPKLEQQEASARAEAAAAEASREAFEKELEDLQPKIASLKLAFSEQLHDKQGADQLSEILDFIDSVGGVTDAQIEIVKQAYRTPYTGGNMCEAWVEAVYRNAGFDVPGLGCAYDGWEAYGLGDNMDNIPVGSYVYGSGTSVPYSHVGILVAEDMVLDNEAAASGHTAVPLDQWLSWQTAVSSNNGQSGWFGWGHPDWIDFVDN